MRDSWRNRFSLASRGVFPNFAAGVALLSVIPVLCVVYLANHGWWGTSELNAWWPLLLTLVIVVTGLTGHALLRRHPRFIVAIRNRLESALSREVPEKAGTVEKAADDIQAIERCVGVIIDELRGRVESIDKEKAQIEEQIVQAQKMESMRTMAIGMAHDYNNLLAAILGNISIVIRSTPPDNASMENALQVEATALQAVELTNQVMAYTGRAQVHFKDTDVSQIARESSSLLGVSVPKGVSIEYQLGDHLPLLRADPNQIRQIVSNLVLNAADSYPNRHGHVVVTTSVRTCNRAFFRNAYLDENFLDGEYLCLEVSDQGCGMPPAVQARMFDPFFTTRMRAHGLGLAVVLGIVRAHSAAIKVLSVPQQGTTVQVYFPVLAADPATPRG